MTPKERSSITSSIRSATVSASPWTSLRAFLARAGRARLERRVGSWLVPVLLQPPVDRVWQLGRPPVGPLSVFRSRATARETHGAFRLEFGVRFCSASLTGRAA